MSMENIVERNNTSFMKQLYEAMKAIKVDKTDPLRYHQRIVHEYVMKYTHVRGLLIYHKMGAGKSILAISIAESLLGAEGEWQVLFMSSKSLHTNMRGTIEKYKKMLNPAISEEEIAEGMKKYDFISMNASNMIEQVYRAVKPEGSEQIEKLFRPSGKLNANVKEMDDEMKKLDIRGTLENCVVIIDEAHNFFNSITNGSGNATALYKLIMNTKRIKVIFLTGSPIVNDPFEIGVALNMIAGYLGDGDDKTSKKQRETLFGEDYDNFDSYFVWSGAKSGIRNRDKFMHRLVGLVSYYGISSEADLKLYPEQLPTLVRRPKMSAKQYAIYIAARDHEIEESNRPSKFKSSGIKQPLSKPQGRASTYRVRSRQYSNFVYPSVATKTHREASGHTKVEYNLALVPDENLQINSKISSSKTQDESKMGLEVLSPKLCELLVDLERHMPKEFLTAAIRKEWKQKEVSSKPILVGPGIIYSQFKDFGVDLLARILRLYGFSEVTSEVSPTELLTYAIISGDVDIEVRQKFVDVFNSPENIGGGVLSVLLVTSTGAEGLDLKNGRFVMVMEPYWHWSRISQIFARVIRLMSHVALPLRERYVQPYIYLSDYPNDMEFSKFDKRDIAEMKKKRDREPTTDIQLYSDSIKNQIVINTFRRALEDASIDCHMHVTKGQSNQPKNRCLMCAPTGRKLFVDNLDVDIREPSRCEPLEEEKIVAQTLIFETDDGDREFKYTKDDDGEFHIFEFNSQLDGYQEIFGDHYLYYPILEELEKKSKSKKSKSSKK